MVGARNATVADPAMLRAQRFARHALNTERLAIQTTLRDKLLDDLYLYETEGHG